MKLYRAKVEQIAREIIGQLVDDGDIEVSNRTESELDIQSVLNEHIRLEREVVEETKDALEARKLPYGQFGRVKRIIAEQKGLALGDEAIVWMCNQVLETFMQSNFVEEIFSEDSVMRRKMKEILKRHTALDDELDVEVRQHIKNLEEGSASWDIEYAKVMNQIRHKRGLDR